MVSEESGENTHHKMASTYGLKLFHLIAIFNVVVQLCGLLQAFSTSVFSNFNTDVIYIHHDFQRQISSLFCYPYFYSNSNAYLYFSNFPLNIRNCNHIYATHIKCTAGKYTCISENVSKYAYTYIHLFEQLCVYIQFYLLICLPVCDFFLMWQYSPLCLTKASL